MRRRTLLRLGVAGLLTGWLQRARAGVSQTWLTFSRQPAFQVPRTSATTTLEITTAPVRVFGRTVQRGAILQRNGQRGYTTQRENGVDVEVVNRLPVPSSVHWHGLILPNAMDGVPFVTQPPIPPGGRLRLRFPLQQDGTFWMHSHYGLQTADFVAEPFVILSPEQDEWADRSVTVMLRDYTAASPEQVLNAVVRGHRGGDTARARTLQGFDWMQPRDLRQQRWDPTLQRFVWGMQKGRLMEPDVVFDALLANERTLDDPEFIDLEPGETVVLRLIAGSSFTSFFVDLGSLEGTLLRTDANPVEPIRGSLFQLALAQRLTIRLTMPEEPGFYPVLAYGEHSNQRCGIVLRSGVRGRPDPIPAETAQWCGSLNLEQDAHLRATRPLEPRPLDLLIPVTQNGPESPYRWGLNGRFYPYRDPIRIREGQRVAIDLINQTPMGHPMHLHGHEFQLVAINGKTVSGPRRDTVLVPKGQTCRIAFDANDPGIWAFHCHITDHHVRGMFNVVAYDGADERWWQPEQFSHEELDL